MHRDRLMESTRRWTVVALGAATLALGACSATGTTTRARGEPALRFSSPAESVCESRGAHRVPARVRQDAYGRPIHFREIPLDRHGAPKARNTQGVPRGNQARCAEEDDGPARRPSDDR